MMSILIYIIIGLVLLVVILGIVAPKGYEVNRTVIIEKPVAEVYNYLKLLKNMDQWSPWAEKDPNMNKSYTGTDGEIGFISAWEGNKEVGSGEQEITGLQENKEVLTELRFLKPWKSVSQGYLRLNKEGKGTKITWGFIGKNKFPISIMMIFMNMEKAIGGDFESGLNKLKSILDSN